jgi:hypothetical protein
MTETAERLNEAVDYVLRYGGNCRDCADESGVCPMSGLPCSGAKKAVRHVVRALAYGIEHGYITSPFASPALEEEARVEVKPLVWDGSEEAADAAQAGYEASIRSTIPTWRCERAPGDWVYYTDYGAAHVHELHGGVVAQPVSTPAAPTTNDYIGYGFDPRTNEPDTLSTLSTPQAKTGAGTTIEREAAIGEGPVLWRVKRPDGGWEYCTVDPHLRASNNLAGEVE